jgi:diacylglycerol kinase (ATP)
LKSTLKPSRFIELVNCAIEGILWAVNSQRHMRAHFLAAAAVLLLALFYRVAALDFVALAFAVTLVLVVELVNTALEVVVDLVSPDYVFPDTVALRSAPSPGALPVFSALVVTILVVLAKGCLGKGTPLHGGMPSGHAAVAFSIATSFVLAPVGPMLSILAVAMAVMVSQSRLLLGIHALREVLVGALLGTGVTLLLYLFLA